MLICIVLSMFVENIPQKVLHSAQICCTFADEITSRDGAEVARWAHNPKVVGSNPAPATKQSRWKFPTALLCSFKMNVSLTLRGTPDGLRRHICKFVNLNFLFYISGNHIQNLQDTYFCLYSHNMPH